MAYLVTSTPSANRAIADLPYGIQHRVYAKIVALADDPRPAGCKKLAGGDGLWRIRIGDYRIDYAIDDAAQQVAIRIVAHRKDVYR